MEKTHFHATTMFSIALRNWKEISYVSAILPIIQHVGTSPVKQYLPPNRSGEWLCSLHASQLHANDLLVDSFFHSLFSLQFILWPFNYICYRFIHFCPICCWWRDAWEKFATTELQLMKDDAIKNKCEHCSKANKFACLHTIILSSSSSSGDGNTIIY